MGIWSLVPWRRENRKQLVNRLDHDAPQYYIFFSYKLVQFVSFVVFFNEELLNYQI